MSSLSPSLRLLFLAPTIILRCKYSKSLNSALHSTLLKEFTARNCAQFCLYFFMKSSAQVFFHEKCVKLETGR